MTSTPQTPDLLAAIVAATRRTVDVRAARVPLADLERRSAQGNRPSDGFRRALTAAARVNVIAECKRRSPSRGVLRREYDAAAVARAYDAAGAAAISVLTEAAFFDGSLDDLSAVRSATDLPILRKDFIVDPYQVFEARAAGADAILLIVAALDAGNLASLLNIAEDAGLDVLVEIHDLAELDVALEAGATIVGVNNRNLRTLEVDTSVSRNAIDRIPDGVVAVAESGLKTPGELAQLRAAGYDAFLIGERFMVEEDPGAALAALLAGAAA